MDTSWSNKYSPKTTSDLFCKNSAGSLITWLEMFETEQKQIFLNAGKKKKIKNKIKSCLLISGPHGSGKSTTINLVLAELGYEMGSYDFETIKDIVKKNKNKELMHNTLAKVLTGINVMQAFKKVSLKKRAIVIENIIHEDRQAINILQKHNDERWTCPMIFVTTDASHKSIRDLKKKCDNVVFNLPTSNDLIRIINKIIKEEHIRIKNEMIPYALIDICQSDIRVLANTLWMIKATYGKKRISMEILQEYFVTTQKKDIDEDLFTAADQLMYKYHSINESLRLYEMEKVVLPMMMHHNYVKGILANYSRKKDQFKLAKRISESLSYGAVVDSCVFGDQKWEMQWSHGYHTCAVPSFYICRKLKKAPRCPRNAFPTSLTKMGQRRSAEESMKRISECFNNMNTYDCVYATQIVRVLLKANCIDECAKLLKDYDLDIDDVEMLTKIDKIYDIKPMSAKHKRELGKALDHLQV